MPVEDRLRYKKQACHRMRKGLVAANWKMNGRTESNAALLGALVAGLYTNATAEVLVCPPAVYLQQAGEILQGSAIKLGAQNIHAEEAGAFTGETSAAMLRDFGCSHVIVGHSERRELFQESDTFIAAKFAAAQAQGIKPVLCVGESREQREAGETEAVVLKQLQAVLDHVGIEAFAEAVLAYEPVWAIGTGLTASPEQAQEVHALIRQTLAEASQAVAEGIRILYGGSVKADNAGELFAQPDIDGGLVGGASLVAEDFLTICNSIS
jgi:triosephosphate isomerase